MKSRTSAPLRPWWWPPARPHSARAALAALRSVRPTATHPPPCRRRPPSDVSDCGRPAGERRGGGLAGCALGCSTTKNDDGEAPRRRRRRRLDARWCTPRPRPSVSRLVRFGRQPDRRPMSQHRRSLTASIDRIIRRSIEPCRF